MARIPYPDPARLSDSVLAVIGDRPANVARMFAAASEPVFHAVAGLGGAIISGSSLPEQLREIAILRVGYLSNSAYEVFQHEALARHVGLSDEQIAAVSEAERAHEMLGEAAAAVLEFVDDVVFNVRASDATLAAVRRHLSDTQVIDLTLVTGAYMMFSRFLETTGVEIDAEAIDWQAYSDASPAD